MNEQDSVLRRFDDRVSIHGQQHGEVAIVSAAEVAAEPVSWLWKDWLPLGKLALLAGPPGHGKTTIAMSFCSIVSRGGNWPDGTPCEAGNVLIVSVEDDLADTLKPRLMAEGDLARCFFVQGTKTPDGLRAIDLSRDMKGIEKAIEDCGGVKLIVLDPVVSAVAGDSHKNTDVRRGLQPIVDLAMRSKAAILGITHFSKVTGALDPASRVIGSIGFVAVARNVFIAQKVKHPNGLERGIFAKAKTNTSSSSGGFEYVVSQVEITEKINASQIVWGEQLEGDATEFFAEAADGMRRSEKDYLDEILKQALRAGPVMTEQILEDLGAAGYTEGKIKRAASRLGVLKRKSGMRGPWTWSLPVEPEIDA